MSLFPLLLLAVSLLGLLGEFPGTYNSIIHYLRRVVPATTLEPLDAAVRAALKSKGTAPAALVLGVLVALYGATGYLEATRRALNVVFDSHHGRSFVRRKLTDLASTVVLLALVLATVVLMFAGVGVVHDLFGPGAAKVWRIGRWPAALISALHVFSFLNFVTPDVEQRAFRWITPGAGVGVTLWLLLGRVLSVHRAFLQLQRDLRLVRRGHNPPHLAVAEQRRASLRRRGQRRDRTPEAARGPRPRIKNAEPPTTLTDQQAPDSTGPRKVPARMNAPLASDGLGLMLTVATGLRR
jgi:virulence factor BrkB